MSRIENNKFQINLEEFSIRNTIQGIKDVMTYQTDQKNIKLEVNISDRVPSKIKSDEKRISQIFYNLISNAIKFTFKGYIKITIDYDNNGFLQTTVEDTGIGIHENEINKLFKFFGKLEKSKNINKGGLGFGLTICKMLVEQMNGTISVVS